MLAEEVIKRALLTHGEWKRRLACAIEQDGAGLSVDVVSSDTQCEFGRWICDEIDAQAQPICERARKAHADFHLEAGRILALAQAKRQLEAKEALLPGSEYARLSGALTLVLDQWRYRSERATQELWAIGK